MSTVVAAKVEAKKILIVEDERMLAEALAVKLQRSGFQTHIVSNGAEGLNILAEENFDLIILDLIMPEMDGFSVLEKLRLKRNRTPVIVASNLRQDQDFERAKKLGAVDYIVKSRSSLSEIAEKVKKIFT